MTVGDLIAIAFGGAILISTIVIAAVLIYDVRRQRSDRGMTEREAAANGRPLATVDVYPSRAPHGTTHDDH